MLMSSLLVKVERISEISVDMMVGFWRRWYSMPDRRVAVVSVPASMKRKPFDLPHLFDGHVRSFFAFQDFGPEVRAVDIGSGKTSVYSAGRICKMYSLVWSQPIVATNA